MGTYYNLALQKEKDDVMNAIESLANENKQIKLDLEKLKDEKYIDKKPILHRIIDNLALIDKSSSHIGNISLKLMALYAIFENIG